MKQILITGASTGIGHLLTKQLCEKGYKVWAGVRKPEVLKTLASNFPNLIVLKLDVTQEADIENAFQKISSDFDPNQEFIIVNNAGIALGGPIETLPALEWKNIFDVNVFGLVNVSQKFIPLIRKSKGRVINIGSISDRIASPFLAPYAASKFAVRAFNDSLRREMLPFGVKVILIEPGPIKTEIWTKSLSQSEKQEALLSPEMQKVYGPTLAILKAGVRKTEQQAVSASEVTAKLIRAIESANPCTSYLVGKNINLLALMVKIMPIKILDKLLVSGFRFKKADSP